MPLITMHYAPIIKRRETLKSMTHRAYGPYALCVSVYFRSRLVINLRHWDGGQRARARARIRRWGAHVREFRSEFVPMPTPAPVVGLLPRSTPLISVCQVPWYRNRQ